MKHLQLPLSIEERTSLRAGEMILLSGVIYTARDAAHKRLNELLDQGKELPLPLQDQIIYYVGPTPTPPGHIYGSAGPTTSMRMDAYAPRLYDLGLAATIGKGYRTPAVPGCLCAQSGTVSGGHRRCRRPLGKMRHQCGDDRI